MSISIDRSSVWAAGRHVLTFATGAVTAAAVLHIISGDDAANATNAINQIASGVASVVAGVSTLVGIGSAMYAAYTATHTSQIKAVAANPDVSQIVTTPAIAASIPSPKVVPPAA